MFTQNQGSVSVSRLLTGMFIFGIATLFLGIPGYLLAVLIVLTFKSVRGGQYWLFSRWDLRSDHFRYSVSDSMNTGEVRESAVGSKSFIQR